jgi:hypothetical protein
VVTIPEGIVNGPDRVFPRNSVFNMARQKLVNLMSWCRGIIPIL